MRNSRVLAGLIGAGIQRSLAPLLHEEEAARHGLRLHYQLIDVERADALPTLLAAARWRWSIATRGGRRRWRSG